MQAATDRSTFSAGHRSAGAGAETLSAAQRDALDRLSRAAGDGTTLICLTGAGGAGKSTVLRRFASAPPEGVEVLLNGFWWRGSDAAAHFSQALRGAGGEGTLVLICDAADALDDAALTGFAEFVAGRGGTGRHVLGVLAGSDALSARLARLLPAPPPTLLLPPFAPEEGVAMIRARLAARGIGEGRISDAACHALHDAAGGNPRRAKAMTEKLLLSDTVTGQGPIGRDAIEAWLNAAPGAAPRQTATPGPAREVAPAGADAPSAGAPTATDAAAAPKAVAPKVVAPKAAARNPATPAAVAHAPRPALRPMRHELRRARRNLVASAVAAVAIGLALLLALRPADRDAPFPALASLALPEATGPGPDPAAQVAEPAVTARDPVPGIAPDLAEPAPATPERMATETAAPTPLPSLPAHLPGLTRPVPAAPSAALRASLPPLAPGPLRPDILADAIGARLAAGLTGRIVPPRAAPYSVVIGAGADGLSIAYPELGCAGRLDRQTVRAGAIRYAERFGPVSGCGEPGLVEIRHLGGGRLALRWAADAQAPWSAEVALAALPGAAPEAAPIPAATRLWRGIPELGPADPEAGEAVLELSAEDRREVQMRLTLAGHDPRGIDGIFGPATRAAIESWQRFERLFPTGYLDARQLDMLEARTRTAWETRQESGPLADLARDLLRRSSRTTRDANCQRDASGRLSPAFQPRCEVLGKPENADR